MAGLVEAYRDLAVRIMASPPRLGPCRLVAVDGPSGAGKTVFADRLTAALRGAAVVHTDDLLDGWSDQLTFWPRLEEWVLAPLRAGRPGRYRRYSWLRREFTRAWVTVPAGPVVILEGVSSARAASTPELTLAVWVTAPDRLRLDRALARDGGATRAYLEVWRRDEAAHFAADRTSDRADLLVDGAPTAAHDPDSEYVLLPPPDPGSARVRRRSPDPGSGPVRRRPPDPGIDAAR